MTTGFENNEFSLNDSNLSNVHLNSQGVNVKVTDYSYRNVNPSPVKVSKDSDLFEEFLSPRKLQALTGVDNLETVEYLEMRVNTDQMSLGNFGMYLPNLTQMKLSGSFIPTIRDLGTSLWNMQVVWMPQCSLHCLDGLVTMCNMRELYLAYNEIEDISSCGMLEHLELLDLEGNHIMDTSNLHYLSMCPNLSRLTLEGNPLCNPSNFQPPMTYRNCVLESIPHLEFLDDISLRDARASGDNDEMTVESEIAANASVTMEEHWNFINSMLMESGLLAESSTNKDQALPLTPDDSGRPSSITSTRPSSAMRPMSAQRRALATALGRPQSSGTSQLVRPSSAASEDSLNGADEKADDSSLTAGQVVCGNLTRSLRHHGSLDPAVSRNRLKSMHTENRPRTSRPAYDVDIEASCEIVLEELSKWRHDYEKSKARIEKSKAPQILTIDHMEDEIEELLMTSKSVGSRSAQCDNQIENEVKPVRKADIKLNPIRNGKLPDRDLPSSWVPKTGKSVDSCKSATPGSKLPHTATNKSAPTQISRIRRQLIQNNVTTITPSKPLLKR